MKIRPDIKRILLVTLTNVGDAILTLPVLDALARNYPGARIDICIGPGTQDIFSQDQRVSKVFVFNKRGGLFEKYRLIKKFGKIKYDLVVDLKNSAIPFFLQPKYRTSFLRQAKKGMHKREEHLSKIKKMGISCREPQFNIAITEEDKKKANTLLSGLRNKKYVVLNIGSKSHMKRWPVENFAGLCQRIREDLSKSVVIIGKNEGLKNPDSDRVIADKFNALSGGKALDIVGKTGIRDLAYIIKCADAIVTNDSGPMHIASAVNTPTIALFGPTDAKKYGPLSDKKMVLHKHLKCSPCEKSSCSQNYECLKKIGVDEVFNALKGICGS